MLVIKDKISKQEISTMSHVIFDGEITVIDNDAQLEEAINDLRQHSILGIDSETRPSFRKGNIHKVALLQVSTDDHCYLFRLNKLGLASPIIALLEDENVMKVGLSLKDDFLSLRRRTQVDPKNCLDLQNVVKNFGVKDLSLQKIYANFFGKKISKSQRLSNWEADELAESQKRYASTDAWTCLKIYELLEKLKESGDYQLQIMEQPETEVKE